MTVDENRDLEVRLARLNDPKRWKLDAGRSAAVSTLNASGLDAGRPSPQRRSPSILAAAAVAVIVMVTAAVAWNVGRGDDESPQPSADGYVIPWIADKASVPADPSQAKPCKVESLEATGNTGGQAMGTYYLPITIRSTVGACSLADRSVVLVADPTGRATTVARLDLSDHDGAAYVTIPGASELTLRAHVPGTCQFDAERSDSVVPVSLDLGAGNVAVEGAELPLWALGCDGAALTADIPVSDQDAGRGPYSHLFVSIENAHTEGEQLVYHVQMVNRGAESYTFADCPSYAQHIFVNRVLEVDESRVLNCAPAGEIRPGDVRTFEMRAGLPAEAQGAVGVVWIMTDGPSTAADTDVVLP